MKLTSGLLVLGVLLSWTESMAGQTVRIATFNAEFLIRSKVHIKFDCPFTLSDVPNTPADPCDKSLWDSGNHRNQQYAEATAAVASVVASLNADVVALVEVGNQADVQELVNAISASGVTYPHFRVCDCTDNTTQQHVAVLSRFPLTDVLTAIPGREHYYEELDDAESENDTGISKGMRVTFTINAQAYSLFVVHLASERGGNEQDQQRIAQASIVRRSYLPLLAQGQHVIVAGDLNDYRGQPAIRRIRGLDDIQEDLIQTGHAEFFEEADLDTRWTYEFQGERNQIDHILVSHSIQDLWNVSAEVPEQNNALASDHRALIVTLKP